MQGSYPSTNRPDHLCSSANQIGQGASEFSQPHLVSAQQLEAYAQALREALECRGAGIQDVHKLSQENMQYAWCGEPSINGTVKTMKAEHKESAVRVLGTAGLYQPALVDVEAMQTPPDVYIVPLGFHAFNMTRMVALVRTLDRVEKKFGSEKTFEHAHIFFMGGRKLLPDEKAPSLETQLNAGLGEFYCGAEWSQMPKNVRKAFCDEFKAYHEAVLGPMELHMEGGESIQFETDSARRIWENSPLLKLLREQVKPDHVHFVETPPEQYKKLKRDNTHGNALQFLHQYGGIQQSKGATLEGTHAVVCSDAVFCPRATLTFKGYGERWHIQFSASSVSFVEQQNNWDYLFLAPQLRESVCILNEVFECSKNPAWFAERLIGISDQW